MIRLTGRFWKQDTVHRVVLEATDGMRSGRIIIEVKRPTSLGTSNHVKKNVFNEDVSIDSLAITHGGRNGIPPQLIKGHMHKEMLLFAPAYRYEPWKDIELQSNARHARRYFSPTNHFVVDSAGMGSGDPVSTTHTNVRSFPDVGPIDYPRAPTTIREYLSTWLRVYAQTGPVRIVHDNADDLTRYWRKWYGYMRDSVAGFSDGDAKRAGLIRSAVDLGEGLVGESQYDRYAQTRIVASYGFLQITHYTATDNSLNGFVRTAGNRPPELLNEESFGLPAYTQLMLIFLGNASEANWGEGYEKGWFRALDRYNHGEPRYEHAVFYRLRLYPPIGN
jgi:hypothetical protein